MYKFSSSNVKIDFCFVLDLQSFYPSEADANVVLDDLIQTNLTQRDV